MPRSQVGPRRASVPPLRTYYDLGAPWSFWATTTLKTTVSDLTAPSQLALRVAELEGQISKLNGLLRVMSLDSWAKSQMTRQTASLSLSSIKTRVDDFQLLKNSCFFLLLGLKRDFHYWKYFLPGVLAKWWMKVSKRHSQNINRREHPPS